MPFRRFPEGLLPLDYWVPFVRKLPGTRVVSRQTSTMRIFNRFSASQEQQPIFHQ